MRLKLLPFGVVFLVLLAACDAEQARSLEATGAAKSDPLLEKIVELRREHPELLDAPQRAIVAQGTLEVIIADDFAAGTSRRTDTLVTAEGERLQLHFAGSVPHLLTGQHVQVEAMRIAEHLVLSPDQLASHTAGDALGGLDPTAMPTVRKLAVILYSYQGYTQPWTAAFARGRAFTDAFSVRNYYQEVSNGQMLFEGFLNPTGGDVFGWYQMPGPIPTCADHGSNDAAALAAADGFVESNYQHVVFAFVGPACSLGQAEQGGRRVWINNAAFDLGVVAHELGHNLGLWHSPSARCMQGSVAVPFSNTCTQSEYGDSFDIMGNAWGHRHFKPANKSQRGWLPQANYRKITADGTYLLAPHALPSTGIQSMQVGEVDGPSFDIEFRQPTGVFDNFAPTDSAVNGVIIRSGSGLLDMTPVTSNADDQALVVGQSFTDPGSGLRITTQAVSASGAQVNVVFGPCMRKTPGIQLSSVFQTTPSGGQALKYTISIVNNDSTKCGASVFTLTPTLPGPGWSQSPQTVSGSIAPGAMQAFDVYVTSPTGSPEALYTFDETARNASSGLSYVVTLQYEVKVPDTTPPALVALTAPLNGATYTTAQIVTILTSVSPDVTHVDFFDGQNQMGGSWAPPFQKMWWFDSFNNGVHTLRARGYDEAGNFTDSATVTVTVAIGLADLGLASLSTTSTTVPIGGSLSAQATVTNQGSALSGASTVRFVLSTDAAVGGTNDIALAATQAVAGLAGGASATASTTLTVPAGTPAGAYFLCASADGDGAVAEANETNNARCTAAPLQVAAADLVVIAISGPSTGIHGVPLILSTTVKNQGGATTGSFSVGLYFSTDGAITTADTRVGTVTMAPLAAGASRTLTATILVPTSAVGSCFLGAIADVAAQCAESNETNNTKLGSTITIRKPTNVALAAAGATATASSSYTANYPASSVINNERAGKGWGTPVGAWSDATYSAYPDWVQINFNGSKPIDRVVVYGLQDTPYAPVEPTDTMTFSLYGLRDFAVQGWNGTSWVTLGTATANTLVKRTFTFPPFTTDRVRIWITKASSYSRMTEVEAWTDSTANLALASAAATVSASSTYNASYPVSSVINNERAGRVWGAGSGGWNDATSNVWPDWVQLNLYGGHRIERVVVYSVQDAYTNPIEPTDTLKFSLYGLRDFTVEGWNGTAWVTLATVSGNNLVKRTVSFPSYSTTKIRVSVTNGAGGYSRITEIEAWGR